MSLRVAIFHQDLITKEIQFVYGRPFWKEKSFEQYSFTAVEWYF